MLPPGRVVTESDGPFAWVTGRIVFPYNTELTSIALAEIWKLARKEIESRLAGYVRRLTGTLLPPASIERHSLLFGGGILGVRPTIPLS
jgi:hypothetical protein